MGMQGIWYAFHTFWYAFHTSVLTVCIPNTSAIRTFVTCLKLLKFGWSKFGEFHGHSPNSSTFPPPQFPYIQYLVIQAVS